MVRRIEKPFERVRGGSGHARRAWRAPRAAAAALAIGFVLTSGAAHAQRQSGIQLTPDSGRYLISKDVGTDRWAISYNLDDKTVTGNVFPTGGGAPQFVWCTTTSVTQADDPAAAQYNLSCQFAQPCAAAPCPPAGWQGSGPVPVTVPGSFLLPPSTHSTLAGNVQPIFSSTCATSETCHAGGQTPDLESGLAWHSTFGVPAPQNPDKSLVAAFQPDASYLLDKVLGIASSGSRMPQGGQPLSDAQIAAIRAWIEEGAANN